MMYSDLHCDSVTRAYCEKISLFSGTLAVKISSDKFIKREQCFALWLDDKLQGDAAFSYFKRLLRFYKGSEDEIKARGITPHLTAENAVSLGGDLNNIARFREWGVEMMSLTWNGENDLASGVYGSGGLKDKGRQAVREMENCGIILDVSHLNDEGFRDVCKIARKPFVASHSNCYDICRHKRNLKRWQVEEIISRGGLIGLNFYPLFLGSGSAFERLKDNIGYILSLGGENCVAFGSDFDGAEMSDELKTAEDIVKLRDYLLSVGMSEKVLNKTFYENSECGIRNAELRGSFVKG